MVIINLVWDHVFGHYIAHETKNFFSSPLEYHLSLILKGELKGWVGKICRLKMTRQFLFYVFKVVWAVHHARIGRENNIMVNMLNWGGEIEKQYSIIPDFV